MISSPSIDRRDVLRGLAALLGGSVTPGLARFSVAGKGRHHHHGNPRNPRKRLRQQCRKECKGVKRNCLDLCHTQGYDDDICHPRCAIAKRSCRQGCS
jgi:hypothetical protein